MFPNSRCTGAELNHHCLAFLEAWQAPISLPHINVLSATVCEACADAHTWLHMCMCMALSLAVLCVLTHRYAGAMTKDSIKHVLVCLIYNVYVCA